MHTDRNKPDVTTAIILEKRVSNKEGKHPVKLRITYQRKRKYYLLQESNTTLKGESYTLEEYNNIQKPNSRGINKAKRLKFDEVEKRAIQIIDSLDEFSFEAFEFEYLNKRKEYTTIQAYFEQKAQELDEEDKVQTANLYRSALISFLKFDKKLSFHKITPKYLKNYENWLIAEGGTYTTVGMYMRNLKHIVNRALNDKIIKTYPFGTAKDKYQIPKSHNTKKALSIVEIEKLYKYQADDRNEFVAQQYWFFSYLCNGMNMADIANLKYKNIKGNSLTFIRKKTKNTTSEKTEINVFLSPEIFQIIDNIGNENKEPESYVFPIYKDGLTAIQENNKLKQHIKNTNKYFNRLAAKAGVEGNITTYWARHSYSTILKRSGAPIEFISEQLGHQSTKVTQNYLDSFEDEAREKFSAKLLYFNK
nr:site-specific integrase [uncultured Marinifilum sp.]